MSSPSAPPDAPPGAASPETGASSKSGAIQDERRARSRRGAALQRASWMSSRARNAARRGALISAVGSIVVISTLLVLVLLPREVDRALRLQLAGIPASQDTSGLLGALERARVRNGAAQLMAQTTRVAASQAPAAAVASALGASRDSSVLARDSLGAELQLRLTRARAAPLTESYKALAESPLVQGDGRVRAIVDSIDQTDREREAYAALGGPDARYAALTARLAALGARIVRIAEAKLEERQEDALSPAPVAPTPSGSPPLQVAPSPNPGAASTPATPATAAVRAADSSGAAIATDSALVLGASTPLLVTRVEVVDTALVNAAAALADTVVTLERSLQAMRSTNANNEARRAAVRLRTGAAVPPIAMLVAALVVGLAIGYGSAVVRELRRPTVGDEGEVERLTGARVIVHAGSNDATRDVRTRRRADRVLSPALDPTAEAWQQLHLTLTGLGDVVRSARVIADQPLLGATLTINLAAAAARESRATLVVEAPSRTPLLSSLLRQNKPRGLVDVQQGRAEVREAITEVPMGRDVAVDVMFAGAPVRNAAPLASRSELGDELRRVAARYDLALVMGDESADVGIPAHDVIVCARLGVTSLEWLSKVTVHARSSGHRLRAVLLWATDTPTV